MPILSTIDTDGYSATNVISATWVITRTGQLLNANSTAFSSTGAVRMTIEGVVAGQTGVEFTTSEGAQSTSPDFVTVTETGLVVGTSTFGYGVSFNDAGSELINAGTIIGWRAVTFASGSNALVSNSGTIQGQATSSTDSIGLRLGGGLVGHIFNSGLIEGDTAILLNGSSATIENTGRILGHGAAGAVPPSP